MWMAVERIQGAMGTSAFARAFKRPAVRLGGIE